MPQNSNFPCDAFQKNADGSITTVKGVTIQGPTGTIQLGPGQTFGGPGSAVLFLGVDLKALYDQNCG